MQDLILNEQRTTNNEQRTTDGVQKMLDARFVMAPMAGVTDVPFRMMVRRFGCRFAFTEMIDSSGMLYKSRRTAAMLKRPPEDSPAGVQISGEDAEKILYTARICEEKGFDVIDVNAGCPSRKVVRGGKGAALLKDPAKLGGIVETLVKNLSVPVTVKIRSGWDEESMNYVEVAKVIESSGAKAICIHPRTKEQMYKGKAEHDAVREVKEAVKIPVFASGNIFSAFDAAGVMERTGCDGVFVARGALGRPWIFRELYDYFSGKREIAEPSFEEIKAIVSEHFAECVVSYGSFVRARSRMYKHVTWAFKRYKGIHEAMKMYTTLPDEAAFGDFLSRLTLESGKYLIVR